MLTAVGNIFIANETRFKYLLASLTSFLFLKENLSILLNIENLESLDKEKIESILSQFQHYELTGKKEIFNHTYMDFLDKVQTKYCMHFEEDHFCVQDNPKFISGLLEVMEEHEVQLAKITFFDVEQKSVSLLEPTHTTPFGNIYFASRHNFKLVNDSIPRYYIGNNSIFEIEFAKSYWSRPLFGSKPHPFEVKECDEQFLHRYIVPSQEILCAIDDDHGLENTCLLKRKEGKYDKLI